MYVCTCTYIYLPIYVYVYVYTTDTANVCLITTGMYIIWLYVIEICVFLVLLIVYIMYTKTKYI